MRHIICKILDISERSYYTFKKQGRPVINLLEMYFSDKDLAEFLESGRITEFDHLYQVQEQVIVNNAKKYLDTFLQKSDSKSIKNTNPFFMDFYFTFLSNFHKFEYQKKFSTLVGDFLVDYIILNQDFKDSIKFKQISNFIYLFDGWDELMSIYLIINTHNNLAQLLPDFKLKDFNKVIQQESYFHIIGLYIYQQYPKLNSLLKIELIKNLHDSVKDEFYTYDLLVQYINNVRLERMDSLKKLGFDKSLY